MLQTATSSIFSIGSQQTKCVRQFPTKEITITSLTNILKLVRLVWVDSRTVVMLTVDGSETKYSVWSSAASIPCTVLQLCLTLCQDMNCGHVEEGRSSLKNYDGTAHRKWRFDSHTLFFSIPSVSRRHWRRSWRSRPIQDIKNSITLTKHRFPRPSYHSVLMERQMADGKCKGCMHSL